MCKLIIYTEEPASRDLAASLAAVAGAPTLVKQADGWTAGADGSRAHVAFEPLCAPPLSAEMLAGPGAADAADHWTRLGGARARYVVEAPRGLEAARSAALLAGHIAQAVGGSVFDPVAGAHLSAAEARGIGESRSADALVRALVKAHVLPAEDGVWVHTHGAARLGLPEVEALSVDPDVAGAAADAAIALLARWATETRVDGLAHARAGSEFPLGEGRARVVASLSGAARPRGPTCTDTPERVALVAADGADLSPLLGGRPAADRAAERAGEERDHARAVIGALAARLGPRDGALPDGVRLFAEVALEGPDGDGDAPDLELVWLPVDRVRDGLLEARTGAPGRAALEPAQVLGVLVTRGDRELATLDEVIEAIERN